MARPDVPGGPVTALPARALESCPGLQNLIVTSAPTGMFPGEGGMVAPGMTCQYIVQFFPDCLGDFDDFILVETQSAHTLLIPLQARRPPPVLTCKCLLPSGGRGRLVPL